MKKQLTQRAFLLAVQIVSISVIAASLTASPALAYKKSKRVKNSSSSTNSSLISRTSSTPSGAFSSPTPYLAPSSTVTPSEATAPSTTCTTGWYITGYFTPLESDYTGEAQTINVNGVARTYNAAFLKEVQTEGWGKTKQGNYVGWYNNSWHLSTQALDANDKPLASNSVAVDTSLIPRGKNLTIPSLPGAFGTMTYHASDVGQSISGKHIDVFTGEGKVARELTYKITGTNNTVCVLP